MRRRCIPMRPAPGMSARNPTTISPTRRCYEERDSAYFWRQLPRSADPPRAAAARLAAESSLGFFNDKVLFAPCFYKSSEGGCAQLQQRHRAGRYLFALCQPLDADVWHRWHGGRTLSLYANHTEARVGYWRRRRPGQCWASTGIAHSKKQDEVGVKIDYGTIKDRWRCLKSKPNAISDTAGNYGLDGVALTAAPEMVSLATGTGTASQRQYRQAGLSNSRLAEGATDSKDTIRVA